jgi:hypothetical protein
MNSRSRHSHDPEASPRLLHEPPQHLPRLRKLSLAERHLGRLRLRQRPEERGRRMIHAGSQIVTGTLMDSPLAGWVLVDETGSHTKLALPVSAITTVKPTGAAPAPTNTTRWVLRSKHFIHGMPKLVDGRHRFTPTGQADEKPGISVLVREGFAVGHYDKFKVPLWVSMRWTRDDFVQSDAASSYQRRFKVDTEGCACTL